MIVKFLGILIGSMGYQLITLLRPYKVNEFVMWIFITAIRHSTAVSDPIATAFGVDDNRRYMKTNLWDIYMKFLPSPIL